MGRKRRSISDVDNDLKVIMESLNNLSDAVIALSKEPEPEPEPTPAEAAHKAEFGDKYNAVESEEVLYEEDGFVEGFVVDKGMYDWYNILAAYHGRTLTQELVYMMKKTYIKGRASAQAELSRSTTISGESK